MMMFQDSASVIHEYLTTSLGACEYVVFSKPNCPECTVVKKLLEEKVSSYDYRVIDVNDIDDEDGIDAVEVMRTVVEGTGAKSYPICFVQGAYTSTKDLKKLITSTLHFDTEKYIDDL